MKKILLLLLPLLTMISVSKAQGIAGVLSVTDYKTIQIINTQYSQTMNLGDIEYQPENGSWSQLTSSLGVGNPSCSKNSAGNNCYIIKPGIEIFYSDRLGEFMMGRLTITNANFGFKIKGQLIKVGDDISKLSSVHADAFSKRHKIPSEASTYQVLLHLEYSGVAISFEYDSQTNCITSIEIFRSLV